MLYIGLGIKEKPFMTLGDAVSSYLACPDVLTYGMCLASKESICHQAQDRLRWIKYDEEYDVKQRRLFSSAGRRVWNAAILFYVVAFSIAIWLLANFRGNGALIQKLGFGAVNEITFINVGIAKFGDRSLILNTLVANAAQPILSVIYFTYNSLCTSMSLARAWETYSRFRKGLRLSLDPQGFQRSSYFLQLPYRFAIPLMTTSALLHWLISQSIFVAVIDTYQYIPAKEKWEDWTAGLRNEKIRCGYSPYAIIVLLVLGVFMVLALLIAGSKRPITRMPLVASCSAAIAAACHVPAGEDGLKTSRELVQWGVTNRSLSSDLHGHCAFSQADVQTPRKGEHYM